jgi:Ca2+-binding EF-hand superfamily protein
MMNPNEVLLSRGLDEEDVERLAMRSNYSRGELCRLLDRFIEIKGNPDFHGYITLEQFIHMPEFRYNPLRKRLKDYWRKEKELQDDKISFFQFISILDVFANEALKKEKLKFLYNVYDVDGDGLVSRKDLKQILKLVTKQMKDEDLDYLVQSVFQEGDLNANDYIEFVEFTKVLAQSGTKKISL